MNIKLTLSAICFTLAACASAPPATPTPLPVTSARAYRSVPQEFRTGMHPEYPTDRFIVGVGSGYNLQEASAMATAHIGSQIQTEISSVLTSIEGEQIETATGHDARSLSFTRLRQDLRQTTHFEPDGMVSVPERTEVDGIVYVLAVLDRANAAARYQSEADKARQAMSATRTTQRAAVDQANLREAARLADEIKKHAVALARALTLQQAVSGRTLGPDAWAEVIAAGDAEANMRRLAATVKVELCVQTAKDFPEGEHLAALLTDQVANRGPTVRLCGSLAGRGRSIRIDGKVRATFVRDDRLPDVWICQPYLDITISQGGRVLSRASLGGELARAGGPDRESASRAALGELSQQSTTKLNDLFGE